MKQSLSFKNGVTNNPSDLVSDDNCLRASIGAEFIDGAHKPIQMPDKFQDNFTDEIVIIHDFADYTHVIAWYPGQEGETLADHIDPELRWYNMSDLAHYTTINGNFPDGVKSAEVIGNTVILNTDDGLVYMLWVGGTVGYKVLGSQLPEIEIKARLVNTKQYKNGSPGGGISSYEAELTSIAETETVEYQGQTYKQLVFNGDVTDAYELFKEAIIGMVEYCITKCKERNHFPFPFWLRAAYTLYNESHAMITNPILILPTITRNNDIYCLETVGIIKASYNIWAGDLEVNIANNISDWNDIITGVELFMSNDVRGFVADGDYSPLDFAYARDRVLADYTSADTYSVSHYYEFTRPTAYNPMGCIAPEQKTNAQIMQQLIDSSVFYKILDLKRNDLGQWVNVSNRMAKNTLVNLTTQVQLEHDDFFGHCKLYPENMITYNGRLQLAGISRGFFDGFTHFITLDAASDRVADVYVEIETPTGTKIVRQHVTGDAWAYWFYYPDPRAKYAYIIYSGSKYKLTLTEHPWLNGAYYFGRLPNVDGDTFPSAESSSTPPTVVDDPEMLPSTIITSEVNNPFVYTADGANDVGSGRIIAITTNTQALSEGQFGTYPLIAFTDEGIWALTTNKEGLYDNAVPLSREVCSNPESITQTDDAIFFASEKGLMLLIGKKAQCVSELLSGKDNDLSPFNINGESIYLTPLREILKYGKIAYDYKGQRLWMYEGNQIWTYNIKSRTFSQIITDDPFKTHSRLYPDCIIQTESGKLLSMLNTPNINDDDDGVYSATIITRPVKLNDTFAYKTITRIGHLWLGEGNVNMEVWGSDDFTNWQHLNSLHGMPWKYYTFRLDFTGMKATDTYHGMLLEYNVRHSNRLHTAFEDSQNQDNEQGTDTTP